MLYKFQNDWKKKKSKWLLTKARYKTCKWKETKNLLNAKTILQCRTLKGKKDREWLRGKGKSINHYKVQCDA